MGAPKITATIDGLTEADFDRIRADGTGSRYEVMLDWTDGDHHELEAHFRLVEQYPTQPAGPVLVRLEGPQNLPPGSYVGHVTRLEYSRAMNLPEITMQIRNGKLLNDAIERERFPVRVAHFGGLGGQGPVFEAPVQDRPGDALVSRLANLIGALISLCHISPRILGIPDGPGPLGERIYLYLTGGEQAMGKHGDGKAADSKNPPSKGGGAHGKGK